MTDIAGSTVKDSWVNPFRSASAKTLSLARFALHIYYINIRLFSKYQRVSELRGSYASFSPL